MAKATGPDELRTEAGAVTGDPRPVWDWTNDLKNPTTLHLEPSFKEELGSVFLQLKQGDREQGIWIPAHIVDSLRFGLKAIADYAEDDSWDTDDGVGR
jgi:hypothetical protein